MSHLRVARCHIIDVTWCHLTRCHFPDHSGCYVLGVRSCGLNRIRIRVHSRDSASFWSSTIRDTRLDRLVLRWTRIREGTGFRKIKVLRWGTPMGSHPRRISPGFVRFRIRPVAPENLNTQLQIAKKCEQFQCTSKSLKNQESRLVRLVLQWTRIR